MNEIKVTSQESGLRIDSYLTTKTEHSRNKIGKMCDNNSILVNDKQVKVSYRVKENDVITISEYEEEKMSAAPEKMELDIIYEDNDIIIVNKTNGIVVHPAIGNNHGTLVNGLLYHSENLSKINGEFRPGIVHRIDAYTTGLLVVAKNDLAHDFLAKQMEAKTTHRKYIALVWGVIENDTGEIDAPIGRDPKDRKKMTVTSTNSKNAVTHFRVLERYKEATLIELQLQTGRTHQIRVHMNYIGYPIVNDPVYGRRKKINELGQCLHAKELGFIHPSSKEFVKFDSELPKKILDIIEIFKNS